MNCFGWFGLSRDIATDTSSEYYYNRFITRIVISVSFGFQGYEDGYIVRVLPVKVSFSTVLHGLLKEFPSLLSTRLFVVQGLEEIGPHLFYIKRGY